MVDQGKAKKWQTIGKKIGQNLPKMAKIGPKRPKL
jgi:hypothetical protein